MSNDTILIVDDEEDIRELIRYNLERDGYKVLSAYSGEEALKTARLKSPDLILLDLMLPGMDGLEVAGKLKADSDLDCIAIIMLTAKGEEADIVTGLEIGADDYITKPFSPRILNARIKAVLRRRQGIDYETKDIIAIHDLIIHPGKRGVVACGKEVELTFSEFQILYFLSKRPGWVFTRSQIVDEVRGDDYPVTDRSVDVQVAGLRKKLGRCGNCIETVRGVGYRFREKT